MTQNAYLIKLPKLSRNAKKINDSFKSITNKSTFEYGSRYGMNQKLRNFTNITMNRVRQNLILDRVLK